MGTGAEFVKKIRPAGAALFLFMLIAFLVICFTANSSPLKGYNRPHTNEYYAGHIEELASELRDNLIPGLGYEGVTVTADGDKVALTAPTDVFENVKRDILYYYDEKLFEFAVREA